MFSHIAGEAAAVFDTGAVASTTSTNAGLIAGVSVAVVNLVVLVGLAVYCIRTRTKENRKKSRQNGGSVASNGSTNHGFRPDMGTIRSFNSLASKYSGPSASDDGGNMDTLSGSDTSSITSIT